MNILNLNFRNILGATAVASMLFVGTTTFTSCGKKGCTDPNATNYDVDATEDDNSCTFDSDKFVGTYLVDEICNPGPINTNNISFSVAQGTANKATVTLTNWGNFGNSVVLTGTVSGNILTLDPNQQFTVTYTGGSSQINISSGTLTLNTTNNTVVISYGFTDTPSDGSGSTSYTCTSTGSKQ